MTDENPIGSIDTQDPAVIAMRKIVEIAGIPDWALASPVHEGDGIQVPEIHVRAHIETQAMRVVGPSWEFVVDECLKCVGQFRQQDPQAFRMLNRTDRRRALAASKKRLKGPRHSADVRTKRAQNRAKRGK